MTILLKHPITEKPEKPGEYWLERNCIMICYFISADNLKRWKHYITKLNPAKNWYEKIELPDDAIIVQ